MPVAAALFFLGGIGSNFALAVAAIAALLLGAKLLWRPGEVPSLLFVFLYQWMQAAIAVFYANVTGVSVEEFLSKYSSSSEAATWLSLLGIVTLAIGMRAGAGSYNPGLAGSARHQVLYTTEFAWMKLFAACWIVCTVAQAGAYIVPGLSQPLLALAQFKWAGFVIITMSTFAVPGRSKLVWLVIFSVELALSFGGYFANFKDVFFFTFIGLAAAGVRVKPSQVIGGTVGVVLLLVLGVTWSAIKTDYREFVSGGDSNQTVQVGYNEQISKLVDLVERLDRERVTRATDGTLKRISYVEFFGAALEYVPAVIPHEGGALWLDAVTRPFMPRILFPNKTSLDDSEMTRQYTGIYVAGADDGTSISIGYVGESYIDFGEFGMVVPIFLLGFFIGRLYHWLVHHPGLGSLYGMSLASAILLVNASRLETTAAKTMGGLAVSFLVVWLLANFVLPKLLGVAKR